VLSHELRTPLNAVVGWVQILEGNAAADTTLGRGLASIKRNAVTQQRLVEDLLDVSRIVTGKFLLERRIVDVRSPVSAALDAVRPIAAAKGVTVAADLGAGGLANADPDRIQQVVSNLLSNAVKFTPAGGRIDVSLTAADDTVALSVADSGQGVAPDLLPFIFDRFRQGEASTTRTHGGLGLGLAIVKHIVEAHGGTIEARSDGEGRGSVFVVRLRAATLAEASLVESIAEETS
jgi:signal transduction histidine kinase